MVQLFCATGGRFNDWISGLIRIHSRPLQLPSPVGVLGDLRDGRLQAHADTLRDRGYVVFPRALSDELCDRLMSFARETPALVRRMDDDPDDLSPRLALYDPDEPLAVRYDYPVDALLDNPDVQSLLADASLLSLAQCYLGSRPRADVLSMWWHTPYHDKPDSLAAQLYHFDLDRIKWIKVFIYLTDVDADDGPHSFILGSHRTGGIPQRMLQRGYVRLSDEEVLEHYGVDKQIVFTAPRGTVIVEDTRGLHKGAVVRGKARLILQLQFSNWLFGATYTKSRMTRPQHPTLRHLLGQAPDVYANYL
jgi:hypothetical protein